SCLGRRQPLRELVGGGVDLPVGRGPAGGDARAARRRSRGERNRPIPGARVRGGETTVRGYAEQRFAGRRGAYGNAELRFAAGRLSFGDLGLFGLADVGRV